MSKIEVDLDTSKATKKLDKLFNPSGNYARFNTLLLIILIINEVFK